MSENLPLITGKAIDLTDDLAIRIRTVLENHRDTMKCLSWLFMDAVEVAYIWIRRSRLFPHRCSRCKTPMLIAGLRWHWRGWHSHRWYEEKYYAFCPNPECDETHQIFSDAYKRHLTWSETGQTILHRP